MATRSFAVTRYRLLLGPELEQVRNRYGYRFKAFLECSGKEGSLLVAAVPAGEPVPENLAPPGGTGVLYVREAEFPWYVDLLRNEGPVTCKIDEAPPRAHVLRGEAEPVGEAEPAPATASVSADDLFGWIEARPNIASALRRAGTAWQGWTQARRAMLRDAVAAALVHEAYDERPDPPPNLAASGPLASPYVRQLLTPPDADALYLAAAGHSLAMELAGRLPWSIESWRVDWLRYLLDADDMFRAVPGGYEIRHVNGEATPCHIRRVWRFLLDNRLLAATPLATVGQVLGWCRDNLVHFSGRITWETFEAHWHYRGLPPVSRIIDGTTGPDPEYGFQHYTAGCMGTTGFLKAVLRAANIPVSVHLKPDTAVSRHTLPGFPSIGRYLTHGDDPYSQLVRHAMPKYPCEELLVTQSRFDELFGPHLDEAAQARGVGRRPVELACRHPSLVLLWDHCADKAAGRGHADSIVYQGFGPAFPMSLAELEAAGLWETLERALDEIGGCGALPPLPLI